MPLTSVSFPSSNMASQKTMCDLWPALNYGNADFIIIIFFFSIYSLFFSQLLLIYTIMIVMVDLSLNM